MKPGRQTVILEIINERNIETQTQLIEALKERGIQSTQATLSRDINELQLVKENGHYVKSKDSFEHDKRAKLATIFKESVISFAVAQNIIVIKTLPGLANAACSALDHMNLEGLVGTLAGDDTAFLAMIDNESANYLVENIEKNL